MQKYKNYWLDRREEKKKKSIKQWKRIEILSSNCWLIWKNDVEKYKERYTLDESDASSPVEAVYLGRSGKELEAEMDRNMREKMCHVYDGFGMMKGTI